MSEILNCRADDGELIPLLDLGEQYLSDYRHDSSRPPKYPLELCMCADCKLVQLKHTTPQAEMYHERYGFKSGVSESIKADHRDIISHALFYKAHPETWLDIASNDGTLLSFVPKNIHREGIDPIKKYCREAQAHASIITNDYFDSKHFPGMKFDVITSISMFYDIPEPDKFVKQVRSILADY